MNKKILSFGASNHRHSINKQFAIFVTKQLNNIEVKLADLNEYASPLYSIDLENKIGVDEKATQFYQLIQECNAIVASFPEYNGFHTSAFKNLWDWMSRIKMDKPFNIFCNKPMFLLSTSPSQREKNNVIKLSKEIFPIFGADIIADFYLPSFNHFFKEEQIIEPKYKTMFEEQKNKFQTYLDNRI